MRLQLWAESGRQGLERLVEAADGQLLLEAELGLDKLVQAGGKLAVADDRQVEAAEADDTQAEVEPVVV